MNTVTVDKATWMRQADGFYVCFRVRDAAAGEEMCRVLQDGKDRELSLRTKKRTLDANAYAWTLMGQLAAKLRIGTDEVYRQYIHHLADICEFVLLKEEAIPAFEEAWCRGHLGRMIEDMGPSRAHPGCHNIRCVYGSSDYDKEQMARFIDLVVQDCKDMGIETLSERERSLLIERWSD